MTHTTTTDFWDRIAPKYATQPISDPDAYESTLAMTRGHLRSGDTVYELGCGTGSTALRLAGDVARYVGSDVSPAMINIARDKLWADPVPGLSFEVASHSPVAPADVVLAFNLLHLLPDPAATVREVFDALPSGGRFISKSACLGRKPHFRVIVAALRLMGKAPYVSFFTVAQLEAMMRDAGFDILESVTRPAPGRYIVARKP